MRTPKTRAMLLWLCLLPACSAAVNSIMPGGNTTASKVGDADDEDDECNKEDVAGQTMDKHGLPELSKDLTAVEVNVAQCKLAVELYEGAVIDLYGCVDKAKAKIITKVEEFRNCANDHFVEMEVAINEEGRTCPTSLSCRQALAGRHQLYEDLGQCAQLKSAENAACHHRIRVDTIVAIADVSVHCLQARPSTEQSP